MSGSRSPATVHTPRYLRASTRRSSAADDLTRRHRSDGLAAPRRGAGTVAIPSKIEASTRHQHSTPLAKRTADASDGRPHRHDRLLPLLFTLREKSGLLTRAYQREARYSADQEYLRNPIRNRAVVGSGRRSTRVP